MVSNGGRLTKKKEKRQITADYTQHIRSNMDGSTKRQEQRQFVSSGLRSTPGSARGRRLGLDVGASSRRPRSPDSTTAASWNGWWRPTNGDAGAPHVVLSRRGASTAQRPLTSSTSQRRQFTVDGGPLRLTAGRRRRPRPLSRLQSARLVGSKFKITSVYVNR